MKEVGNNHKDISQKEKTEFVDNLNFYRRVLTKLLF